MADQVTGAREGPILVDEVDRLVQYADTALDDPALLASLSKARSANRVFTDVVDRLVEYAGQTVDAPTPLNGQQGVP